MNDKNGLIKTRILTILNYANGEILIYIISNTPPGYSNIEDYITNKLHFNLDEISYMISSDKNCIKIISDSE